MALSQPPAPRLGSEMRRLPYGANYLDWSDMTELEEAFENQVLFRYQAPDPSMASRLERTVCDRFGARHALAVTSCTQGLRLSLMSTRPRPGDLVYIPAVTFVAVAGAVLSCGLIPVLTAVDENFHLDPASLPEDAERVIIAHMEGFVGGLPTGPRYVIEDCAQAFGGRSPAGRYVGTEGWSGAFSFHHNKVLTTGEGGIITTPDPVAWERMRMYHDHGCERVQGEYPRWSDEAYFGENCVAPEAVAAIGLQQMRHLDEILEGLGRAYDLTVEQLIGARPELCLQTRKAGDVPISVRVDCTEPELRDRAVERLRNRGLPYWTLDRYFLPDHPVLTKRRSLYADGFPWNLSPPSPSLSEAGPLRERLSRILCLPLAPELTESEQLDQANDVRAVLERL
jgi:dTDP-4-amino-4,6-dideoxygalactose transaminase